MVTMTIFQAIVLGIVQALTEFLPVSSSGHLVLVQRLFGLAEPPIFFDVVVHVGTLLAILFYLREEILKITKKTVFLIIIGLIPIVVFGFLMRDSVSVIFDSLLVVGFSLLGTSLILASTLLIKNSR